MSYAPQDVLEYNRQLQQQRMDAARVAHLQQQIRDREYKEQLHAQAQAEQHLRMAAMAARAHNAIDGGAAPQYPQSSAHGAASGHGALGALDGLRMGFGAAAPQIDDGDESDGSQGGSDVDLNEDDADDGDSRHSGAYTLRRTQ